MCVRLLRAMILSKKTTRQGWNFASIEIGDCRQKPFGINPFSVIKGVFHPAPLFHIFAGDCYYFALWENTQSIEKDVYAGQNNISLNRHCAIQYCRRKKKKTGPAGHST